jgi:hypothetical protein
MGGGISKDGESKEQFMKLSITMPNFKLDLNSATPDSSLAEVRKLVEAMGIEDEGNLIEDMGFYELKSRLSEEFFQHPDLLARVKSSMVLDEEIRILKHIIPIEQEYDLESGKRQEQVNVVSVKSRIGNLFSDVEISRVKECLVHIRGELSREQQCIVMDAIKQRLGVEVTTRFFSTKKNLENNVLVEAVCFGDAIAEL